MRDSAHWKNLTDHPSTAKYPGNPLNAWLLLDFSEAPRHANITNTRTCSCCRHFILSYLVLSSYHVKITPFFLQWPGPNKGSLSSLSVKVHSFCPHPRCLPKFLGLLWHIHLKFLDSLRSHRPWFRAQCNLFSTMMWRSKLPAKQASWELPKVLKPKWTQSSVAFKAWHRLLQTKPVSRIRMTFVIWLFKAFMEGTCD